MAPSITYLSSPAILIQLWNASYYAAMFEIIFDGPHISKRTDDLKLIGTQAKAGTIFWQSFICFVSSVACFIPSVSSRNLFQIGQSSSISQWEASILIQNWKISLLNQQRSENACIRRQFLKVYRQLVFQKLRGAKKWIKSKPKSPLRMKVSK